jgi:hypothetical protein
MILAAVVVVAAPAAARSRGLGHRMRTPHVHAPRLRKPRSRLRTVRLRGPHGAVMTGYRDSFGTHLRGPDGRIIHCQRQAGAADIDIACR